jgi:hypothetical protein
MQLGISFAALPLATPEKQHPGTHWRAEWVGPTAGIGVTRCPYRESNPDSSLDHHTSLSLKLTELIKTLSIQQAYT